jgi:hypothetical protein
MKAADRAPSLSRMIGDTVLLDGMEPDSASGSCMIALLTDIYIILNGFRQSRLPQTPAPCVVKGTIRNGFTLREALCRYKFQIVPPTLDK